MSKPWKGLAPVRLPCRHRGPRSPMPFGLATVTSPALAAEEDQTGSIAICEMTYASRLLA
jgi:hypothetical protein